MTDIKKITTEDLDLTTLVENTMKGLFASRHEDGAEAWEAMSPLEREFASRPILPIIWSLVAPLLEQVNAKLAGDTPEDVWVVPDTLEGLLG